jgi:hypothetical protein
VIVLLYTYGRLEYILFAVRDGEGERYAFPANFFFETSHAFSEVTSLTCDRFVRNSGFEAQIIADLRPILRVPPGQRYRGASGGLDYHT